MPVGYYELRSVGASNRLCIGVIAPLQAPTPLSSPIGVDLALSGFFSETNMDAPANLCALAGMNRVRDRMWWEQVETRRGEFAAHTPYDTSAETEHRAGLQVLQVLHKTPAWANTNGADFPLDLRDIYNFLRHASARWKDKVMAYEPWNEADIAMFGGHTGSEIASYQKAAYLGLKAGNPNVIACQNVFAIHRSETLHDFGANEVTPYFDTFNFHHYEPLPNYPKMYDDFRAVSGGKPLWISECALPVDWSGDATLKELSDSDARLQSERLCKTFVGALSEGAAAVFYFVLPHYPESRVQFGVLRPDLSPRPAYVALAAVGRLLADAHPLGSLQIQQTNIHGYVFHTRPDGKSRDVLVIWTEQQTNWNLGLKPSRCFDHLGREKDVQGDVLPLSEAPLYVFLPRRSKLKLDPPPRTLQAVSAVPSKIVLQALVADDKVSVDHCAYKIPARGTNVVAIYAYNFGTKKARGRLAVSRPAAWNIDFPLQIEIEPGERKPLGLRMTHRDFKDEQVRISGEFGTDGKVVLALHFIPETP
jgi:hypothetical protein